MEGFLLEKHHLMEVKHVGNKNGAWKPRLGEVYKLQGDFVSFKQREISLL